MYQDIGLDHGSKDMISKTQAAKMKKEQIRLQGTKKLHTGQELRDGMDRKPEWEKIFANHICDRRLISRLGTEIQQPNSKETNNLAKNG